MIINDLPILLLRALILTILFETTIALVLGIRDKKDILNIILVNCLTNPLVASIPVYFNLEYGLKERAIAICILEVTAFLTEGFIYMKVLKYKKINPFVISLILNIGSFGIGEIINHIF